MRFPHLIRCQIARLSVVDIRLRSDAFQSSRASWRAGAIAFESPTPFVVIPIGASVVFKTRLTFLAWLFVAKAADIHDICLLIALEEFASGILNELSISPSSNKTSGKSSSTVSLYGNLINADGGAGI
ncbi:hypothetical protein FIBSPDRAFT_891715 [Athelia psychrophila]|uniref:Uncharacterized protein n=1 Tax=Athelia psychrophila TaxID=1759441 RepID=A0A166J8V7_9AGAM|nr:hypothetical protein FIBSPDRAFT_891715 [Fibularhizoctonia sp. CBS 109695]